MAGELQADWTTGRAVYFLLRNSAGQVWNGAAFENYVTANYATYPITAAEQGTASGYYAGAMPAAAAGFYGVEAKERAGGSPAETDATVGSGDVPWSGTAAVAPDTPGTATLLTRIPGVVQPQTGDAYARVGAAGAGLTAVVLAAAGLDAVMVAGKSMPQAVRYIGAVVAGTITNAGTTAEAFADFAGVAAVTFVTPDAAGDRTSAVYT